MRPTSVRLAFAVIALTALTAPFLFAPSGPAGADAGQAGDPPRRIVVISIPRLGWDDVRPATMPNVVALAGQGGLASLSVKTFGRHTERGAGYATLGAGNRTTAPDDAASGARGSGTSAGGIVVPAFDAVLAANADTRQGSEPGALGSAIQRAGWSTTVIANHDGPAGPDRTAALGVANQKGSIDAGSVSTDLTRGPRSEVPRTNGDQMLQALATADAVADVALIEIGDLAWADDAGPDGASAMRTAAARRTDILLGRVLSQVDLRTDLVIVLAPVAPHGPRDQPTPFVIAGAGTDRGWARSASTRLDGYVTLPDVAPTILARLDVMAPASMTGTPIEVRAGGPNGHARPGASLVASARHETAEIRFVDGAAGRLLSTIPIVFACWAFLALVVSLVPPGAAERALRAFVRWVALVQIALPGVTFAGAAWSVRSWGQPAWGAAMWGSACVLAAGAGLLRRPGRAPILLAAATWVLLVGDLVTGGRLQFTSALGNSATVAGRFSGIGNLAFGLLAGTTILVAIAVHRLVIGRTGSERWALTAAASIFGVAIIVDGAPSLGSDIGGVLTLVPAAAATLALLAPRRPRAVRVLAMGAATTVAVIGGFAVADRLRPAGDASHLARFTDRIADGSAGDIVWRKADAAVASVTGSSLVWITVCTLIALSLLLRFARPAITAHLANRWVRSAWVGGATACVIGAVLNDSGVMVPAMMLLVLVPTSAHVLLRPGGPLSRGVSP